MNNRRQLLKLMGASLLGSQTVGIATARSAIFKYSTEARYIGKYLIDSQVIDLDELYDWALANGFFREQTSLQKLRIDIQEDREREKTLWVNDWLISETEANYHALTYLCMQCK